MSDSIAIQSLKKLITEKIPLPPKVEVNFLDIANMPHYEDVITRLYAWFLKANNNHGLENLFEKVLLELINSKLKITLTGTITNIYLQHTDKNGGRIDMLLEGKNQEGKWWIVIENKIYHFLNNDLKSYLESISDLNNRKHGVLLTLSPHLIPENVKANFCNITHRELIGAIQQQKSKNLSGRQQIYFEDFVNVINNLTLDSYMNEYANFFFEHPKQVNDAIQCKTKAEEYILSQLADSCNNLDMEMDYYNYELAFRYFYKQLEGEFIYYTIFYDKLLTSSPSVTIVLEFWKNYKDCIQAIEKKINDDLSISAEKFFETNGVTYLTKQEKNYCHFLSKTYILSKEQIETLSEFIYDVIINDFSKKYDKILDIILPIIKGNL